MAELVVDRHVELAQQRDRLVEALAAAAALGCEDRLERLVVRVHPEAEDVELALPQPEVAGDDGVDLDAGDERQAGRDSVGGDHLAVAGQRVVVGQGEEPDAGVAACRTSSTGATTPSERVVWVWRSIVDGAGGSTRPEPVGASGSWRRRRGAAVMSRLDEPLDPLDGEGTAGRRIDVDLDGVEDDGPLARPRSASAGR